MCDIQSAVCKTYYSPSHTFFFLQEGDVISPFDRVCEVQSDKATVEITSRFGGVVARVHSNEGDIVKVRAFISLH